MTEKKNGTDVDAKWRGLLGEMGEMGKRRERNDGQGENPIRRGQRECEYVI